MGQVAALGQIHPHHGIARLQQSKIHGDVGLGTGMGLHIGKLRAKQPAGPVDGQLLHLVHIHAAAIVTVAGIPFCIFIGQYAAHGGHHRRADNVFAGNQFNVPALALQLPLHSPGQFRIGLAHQSDGIHHGIIHSSCSPFPYFAVACSRRYGGMIKYIKVYYPKFSKIASFFRKDSFSCPTVSQPQ